MTAVNLIPRESRPGRFSLSTSPQTLGLLAGLALALVAALLYVSAASNVTAHRNELNRVTTSAAAWKTVAGAFEPYELASQQRAAQLAAIRQLAAARFPWPTVLDQVAALLPSDAALSSLNASPAAGSSGSGSSAASASGTTSASAPVAPTFQLSGCATSQSAVAQTMEQLRGVDGGSAVTLSSATGKAAGTGGSGSSSSATSSSGGGCTYPVQFQMTLTLTGASSKAAHGSATASLAAGSSTTTSSATTSSAGAATAPTTQSTPQ